MPPSLDAIVDQGNQTRCHNGAMRISVDVPISDAGIHTRRYPSDHSIHVDRWSTTNKEGSSHLWYVLHSLLRWWEQRERHEQRDATSPCWSDDRIFLWNFRFVWPRVSTRSSSPSIQIHIVWMPSSHDVWLPSEHNSRTRAWWCWSGAARYSGRWPMSLPHHRPRRRRSSSRSPSRAAWVLAPIVSNRTWLESWTTRCSWTVAGPVFPSTRVWSTFGWSGILHGQSLDNSDEERSLDSSSCACEDERASGQLFDRPLQSSPCRPGDSCSHPGSSHHVEYVAFGWRESIRQNLTASKGWRYFPKMLAPHPEPHTAVDHHPSRLSTRWSRHTSLSRASDLHHHRLPRPTVSSDMDRRFCGISTPVCYHGCRQWARCDGNDRSVPNDCCSRNPRTHRWRMTISLFWRAWLEWWRYIVQDHLMRATRGKGILVAHKSQKTPLWWWLIKWWQ